MRKIPVFLLFTFYACKICAFHSSRQLMEVPSFYYVPKVQQSLQVMFFSWTSEKCQNLKKPRTNFYFADEETFAYIAIIHLLAENARKRPDAVTKLRKLTLIPGVHCLFRNNDI